MEMEELIRLPDPSNSGDSRESGELHNPESVPGEASSPPKVGEDMRDGDECNSGIKGVDFIGAQTGMPEPDNLELNENGVGTEEVMKETESFEFNEENIEPEEGEVDGDNLVMDKGDIRNENTQFSVETEVDMDLVDSPIRQVNIEVAETVAVSGNLSSFGFTLNAQSDALDTQKGSIIHEHSRNGACVKRARVTYDEQQPSVHVAFNSLTRTSKRKLEELLQQWSEWHVKRGSSSQDLDEELESGEETYFPALCVGTDKSSTVSFWIENQTNKQPSTDFIPSNCDSVPLYDRGFAFGLTSSEGPSNAEGGLEIVNEAARCFNCGSYSHSMKECRKPRNNAAVNNARKQHKSKRNQNAGSRNATRYYQNSSGGKYDGLKPGSLDAETRKLLGLRELDPPPWLYRMRELGYPPGYLDPDGEDQPSGITIFADEDVKEEHEDGEITQTDNPEPPRKMTVEFPGMNALIPENADERIWALGAVSHNSARSRPVRRSNHSAQPSSRWHHNEQRETRDSFDDNPPAPGVDPVFSSSSYPPRHGTYDSSYSFDSPKVSGRSLSRSHTETGRWNPLEYEDYAIHGSYSRGDGSDRLERETDKEPNDYSLEYSHRNDEREHDHRDRDRDRDRNRHWSRSWR
ncbi:uncharacterized protein LOC126677154 isoform X2 [Mercurialis annua]|uniref:uncharacterized protein LOC126677154 isoform X2 n=1 Tax=Mercurialis annua TaxID=3986 RepID=UPI0021600D0C|nr:uncharacterized protein LOC126677154 isoform X2 [Mercurialis annua]